MPTTMSPALSAAVHEAVTTLLRSRPLRAPVFGSILSVTGKVMTFTILPHAEGVEVVAGPSAPKDYHGEIDEPVAVTVIDYDGVTNAAHVSTGSFPMPRTPGSA